MNVQTAHGEQKYKAARIIIIYQYD